MNSNNSSHLEEVTTNIDKVYQGKIIDLQLEHILLPNGDRAVREVVKHPGAVAVLAIDQGKMIVVEQYRKPLNRTLVEIPAGKLDPGEDPLEAAHRELQEETGYRTASMRLLCSFYTSPGFADELIYLYVADQLAKGEASPDEDEFLDVAERTLAEVKQDIAGGAIRDAKTIMAVYAWELSMMKGEMPS